MKKCPQCAEEIQDEAVVCRYCGARLGVAPGMAGSVQDIAYTAQSTNGYAIASLVLGILWMWWIGSVLALVFGYKAKREIRDSGGRQSGAGLATAGIVLGWVGVAAAVLAMLFAFMALGGGMGPVEIETFDVPVIEISLRAVHAAAA